MNDRGIGQVAPRPGVDLEVDQEIHLSTGNETMNAVLTVAARDGGPGSGVAPQAAPVSDLRIRVRLMPGTGLRFVREVFPTRLDLTAHHTGPDRRTVEFSTGPWGGRDSRDYQLCLEVDHAGRPQGEDLQIAVVELVAVISGTTDAQRCGGPSPIVVHWTDDPNLSCRVDPEVAHYSGQNEIDRAVGDAVGSGRLDEPAQHGGTDQAPEPVGPDRTCAMCLRVSPGNARYCGVCGDRLGGQDEPARRRYR